MRTGSDTALPGTVVPGTADRGLPEVLLPLLDAPQPSTAGDPMPAAAWREVLRDFVEVGRLVGENARETPGRMPREAVVREVEARITRAADRIFRWVFRGEV